MRNAYACTTAAPPIQMTAAVTWIHLKNVYQVMAPIESEPADDGRRSEQLLELHRSAHVALDLQLAGHVGAGRILLAARDLLERLLRGRDHGVRILAAFGDAHLAVVDVYLPFARSVDVEQERVGHTGCLLGIDAALEGVEELLRGHARQPSDGRATGRAEGALRGALVVRGA